MTIRTPDNAVPAIYADGVDLRDKHPQTVLLNFFVVEADEWVSVQRIALAADSLEPLYVEIGSLLQRRREAERGPAG